MMFKRIASKYERVVGMVSLTKMDSSILLKLFNDVMNATTTTGYDIVTSLVDGHYLKCQVHEKELRAGKPTSFIAHPLDQHQFL